MIPHNRFYTFIAGFLLLAICCFPRSSPQLWMINGSTMGTVYSVKIPPAELAQLRLDTLSLPSEIDSLLQEINFQMSTYLPHSEISRFNQFPANQWFPVSRDLYLVIEKSLAVSRLSQGAFDITVGPLVNLWGFGPENRPDSIPAPELIRARLKWIGYQKLALQASPPAIRKNIPEVYCDLSAIAKGFGVDKLAEYLDQQKLQNYLVDIGGEIKARGKNHLGKHWKIGISTPDEKFDIQKVIPLENIAVATSGDYRN